MTETTEKILEIVNEWESADKSDFIVELMEDLLTPEQRDRVFHCLQYNLPLAGDGK